MQEAIIVWICDQKVFNSRELAKATYFRLNLILQIDAKGFKYSTDTQNHNLSTKLQEIDL